MPTPIKTEYIGRFKQMWTDTSLAPTIRTENGHLIDLRDVFEQIKEGQKVQITIIIEKLLG